MPTLRLTVNQVIELVQQLPQKDRSAVLHALKSEKETRSPARFVPEEHQLRAMSAERGIDWDKLSQDDRDAFAENLQHKEKAKVSR